MKSCNCNSFAPLALCKSLYNLNSGNSFTSGSSDLVIHLGGRKVLNKCESATDQNQESIKELYEKSQLTQLQLNTKQED